MASPDPVSVADGSAKYPYTTLKGPHAFRLLRFAVGTESMSCTMQEFDRDSAECPAYTALSYAWGDASIKKPMLLDNVPVLVTTNLHEALLQLRESFPDIVIWIDALCIDQDSLKERGHQVAQMKEIYSEAEKVISWLGPGSEETTPLFDAIRIFDDTDEAERTSILQLDNETHYRAFENFMTRPYWSRAWVVQEMAVATDLLFMCGNDVMKSDYLLDFIFDEEASLKDKKWVDLYFGSLFGLRGMRNWRLEETNMAKAFMWTSEKEATEPRDNLYAILGLINEGAGRDIEPDYTISECELYAKAIRTVNKDFSGQCLRFTDMRQQYDEALETVVDILASQAERCPESFLLHEDLVQHCPHLKPLDSKSQPQTACSGCDLFDALFTICDFIDV